MKPYYKFLLVFFIVPMLSWSSIPKSNDKSVLKQNKVSYVLLKMCGESTCYAVEDRYDKRGNHIYFHLLRTGSGSISTFNEKNQLVKTSWGLWGMPTEIDDVYTYSYDSCGNKAMQVFLTDNDTTRYINEYDKQCRLIKTTEVKDGRILVQRENYYDENGWLTECMVYSTKRTYERDSCGRVLTETWYRADTVQRQWRNAYDRLGRLVHTETEPTDEVRFIGEGGDCETELFTYNEKGQVDRHYAYFGDPCVGGYYMDLEYVYHKNGLLKGAYWYGEKDDGMIIEYLYHYHR